LNELRIAEYLVSNFEDRAATFYRDVFRLPAAHLMVVGETELRLRSERGARLLLAST